MAHPYMIRYTLLVLRTCSLQRQKAGVTMCHAAKSPPRCRGANPGFGPLHATFGRLGPTRCKVTVFGREGARRVGVTT